MRNTHWKFINLEEEEVDYSSATDNEQEQEDVCENVSDDEDDDYLEENDDDNVFDDVDEALRKLKNVNKKHNPLNQLKPSAQQQQQQHSIKHSTILNSSKAI